METAGNILFFVVVIAYMFTSSTSGEKLHNYLFRLACLLVGAIGLSYLREIRDILTAIGGN